jgi:hypothetical protein
MYSERSPCRRQPNKAFQNPDVAQVLELTAAYGIGGHDRFFVNIQPDEGGGIVTHADLH